MNLTMGEINFSTPVKIYGYDSHVIVMDVLMVICVLLAIYFWKKGDKK